MTTPEEIAKRSDVKLDVCAVGLEVNARRNGFQKVIICKEQIRVSTERSPKSTTTLGRKKCEGSHFSPWRPYGERARTYFYGNSIT